jgi:hypothetical protein
MRSWVRPAIGWAQARLGRPETESAPADYRESATYGQIQRGVNSPLMTVRQVGDVGKEPRKPRKTKATAAA